ncbi:MAG: hypothetical protein ACRD1Y_01340 [Terriglobales bacterium]
MRKKQHRYKLLHPEKMPVELSPRAQAIVTIVQWAFWFALAGILVAFLLLLSLFTHYRVSVETWLHLWPASVRLMTATGGPSKGLAIGMTVENGLLYCAIGILLGFIHVAFRSLRQKLKPRYN